MATDFAFATLIIPVLACIAVVSALAVGRPISLAQRPFVGLTVLRVSRGYLGALLAVAACAIVSATLLALDKVLLGHITSSELRSLLPGYVLYIFVLTLPIALFVITVMGLPAIALLAKFQRATLLAVVFLALAFSSVVALWTMLSPYNLWCNSHLPECVIKSFMSTALNAVPVAVGFSLGAGLALKLRSPLRSPV